MTVIIALKHKGINYIAADRRITAGPDLICDDAIKILQHNDCLIWLAWDVLVDWLIKKILADNKTLKCDSPNNIMALYLALRTAMKDHWMLEIWESPMFQWLFVTDKHIYHLDYDGAIIEFKDYACIWCWTDYAIWILHDKKIVNPEKDLKDIIKSVSKYSVWVWANSIVKVAITPKVLKAIKKAIPIKKLKKKSK